jgi:hypothetical protein
MKMEVQLRNRQPADDLHGFAVAQPQLSLASDVAALHSTRSALAKSIDASRRHTPHCQHIALTAAADRTSPDPCDLSVWSLVHESTSRLLQNAGRLLVGGVDIDAFEAFVAMTIGPRCK